MPTQTKGVDALSDRQKEVLRLTAQHLIAKEIARRLKITERTVRAHTESARQRLGASTSREAVRIFMAYESNRAEPIVSNDQWPSTPIAQTTVDAAVSGNEPDPTLPYSRNDQLQACGDIPSDAGGPHQVRENFGEHPGFEGRLSRFRSSQDDLQHDSTGGFLDGSQRGKTSWDGFRRRLKDLPAFQVMGLIVIAAVALALIAGMLAGTLLGMVEAVHKLTIYAGWKS